MRVNISIPDALHGRLERVRDRVNVSRLCTVALERELDMIEARPSVTDPKIAQLVERLKGSWGQGYDRGHEDGMQWGVEEATRADLQEAAETFRGCEGRQMAEWNADHTADSYSESPWLPGVNWWKYDHALEAADPYAYLEGWRDALVELWDAVAPALR